ncbi:MAG: DUF6252 family protein [Flavobacteriaceae bacterium]|nr:DUF6252 family protein [Flavobacteriaceae bacterium]
MKNLLLLFTAVLFFVSCDNVEDNSHIIQADVENVFFKADSFSANYHPVGNYFILEGQTGDEILSLKIEYPPANIELDLGMETESYGTFTNSFGVVYTTNTEGGSGKVIINKISTSSRFITGDFNFTAISSGLDTLTVSGGIFYQAKYGTAQ